MKLASTQGGGEVTHASITSPKLYSPSAKIIDDHGENVLLTMDKVLKSCSECMGKVWELLLRTIAA
jgi:hypothetical protein